jgi:MFS family permease
VNYLYDATTGDDRTKYLAYFNCGNGLAAGIGALLGGFLVTHMPVLRGSQVLSIFLISGIFTGRRLTHLPAEAERSAPGQHGSGLGVVPYPHGRPSGGQKTKPPPVLAHSSP